MKNVISLRSSMQEEDCQVYGIPSPIVPVFVGDESLARLTARQLARNGLVANLVEYPAVPMNQARFRFQVMSTHQPGAIREASAIMAKSRREADRYRDDAGLQELLEDEYNRSLAGMSSADRPSRRQADASGRNADPTILQRNARSTVPLSRIAPASKTRERSTIPAENVRSGLLLHFVLCNVIPGLGAVAAIVVATFRPIGLFELSALTGMWLWAGGFGVSVGLHRHFTHRDFEATNGLRVAMAIAGSMSAQGPLVYWVSIHRRHHECSDRPGDPHSPLSESADFMRRMSGPMAWPLRMDFAARRPESSTLCQRPAP